MIKNQNGYFAASDGTQLYYEANPVKNPRAGLIFLHGMGEHLARYQHCVDEFNQHYSIYRYDQRGQGKSGGPRAYSPSMDQSVADLKLFIEKIAALHDKVILVAHSYGGQVAINCLAAHPNLVNALILSSPNIRVAFPIPKLKRAAGKVVAHLFPTLRISNEVESFYLSHDSRVVTAYDQDPLVNRSISLKLAGIVLDNQEQIMSMASKILVPILLMHAGEDHVCSAAASKAFYQQIGSKDKTLKIYPGLYHELFNEIGKEQVFTDMHAWLDKRF